MQNSRYIELLIVPIQTTHNSLRSIVLDGHTFVCLGAVYNFEISMQWFISLDKEMFSEFVKS